MKSSFIAVFSFIILVLILAPQGASAAARSLTVGMSGSDVTSLQTALIVAGYLPAGKNTGYFGSLTLAAIQKFQCDQKIICSGDAVAGYGIAGPRTQAALGAQGGSVVASGSQNPSAVTGTSLT